MSLKNSIIKQYSTLFFIQTGIFVIYDEKVRDEG